MRWPHLAFVFILMTFAFFLARENKGLLVGEAISRKDYRRIAHLVFQIPEVNRIVTMRTIHFAPEDVLVTMEGDLKDGLYTDKIEVVIDKIEQRGRASATIHQSIHQRFTLNWSRTAVQLIMRKARTRRIFESLIIRTFLS